MNFDLLLRYAIIQLAISLACTWIQSFYEPWPLVHAFDLADTAQEQLFQSLGARFGGSLVGGVVLAILSTAKLFPSTLSGTWRSLKIFHLSFTPTDTPANPLYDNPVFGLVDRVFGPDSG